MEEKFRDQEHTFGEHNFFRTELVTLLRQQVVNKQDTKSMDELLTLCQLSAQACRKLGLDMPFRRTLGVSLEFMFYSTIGKVSE